MKTIRWTLSTGIILYIAMTLPVFASEVENLATFSAGTPALAAEVNGNFSTTAAAVNDNVSQIQDMANQITELTEKIAQLSSQLLTQSTASDLQKQQIASINNQLELQSNEVATFAFEQQQLEGQIIDLNNQVDAVALETVTDLAQHVSVETDAQGHPAVIFSGVNVHINNGTNSTYGAFNYQGNGTGNLIVGYDEPSTLGFTCADSRYAGIFDCNTNGQRWAVSHKSGSHNVVIGGEHNYSHIGSLIAGFSNRVNMRSGSVTGGNYNTVSGRYGSVTGGSNNQALSNSASVMGGFENTAGSINSILSWMTVTGGNGNTATGQYATVSGGSNNRASQTSASVSGGSSNLSGGLASSISGGRNNRVGSGSYGSISGGDGLSILSGSSQWTAPTR